MRKVYRWAGLVILAFIFVSLSFTLWNVHVYIDGDELLQEQLISLEETQGKQGTATIPKIIHQLYKTEAIPEQWQEAQKSCQDLHSDWEYKFWTDAKALEFMELEYSWFLPTYHSYPYEIQRVDAIRYFILYHYGGFYLDLDVGCKKPMTPLLQYEAVLPKTSPVGVSNDMMASRKSHPLFYAVTQSLTNNNYHRGTKYPTVHFSTGPMFLSTRLIEYLRSLKSSALPPPAPPPTELPDTVRILPPELYGSAPDSFFRHYQGSSWHGSDASAIKYLARNQSSVLVLVGVVFVLILVVRVVRCCRARRRNAKLQAYKMEPLGNGNGNDGEV